MKRMIIGLVILIFIFLLTGCDYDTTPTIQSVSYEASDFKLVTDSKTGIVYIDNFIKTKDGDLYKTYHIYTPYYSKNGMVCRFDDGRIIEINEDDD